MNVRLLRQIQKDIVRKPALFNMGDWMRPIGKVGERASEAACGTECCIGGWALLHDGWKTNAEIKNGFTHLRYFTPAGEQYMGTMEDAARKALDLTNQQADRLFYTTSWPEDFMDAYELEDDPMTRAMIAVKRIDHFIATSGEE